MYSEDLLVLGLLRLAPMTPPTYPHVYAHNHFCTYLCCFRKMNAIYLTLVLMHSCTDSYTETMAKRKGKTQTEENVQLGPQVAEGENVFGVAHIFASFNDTFVHVTDLSGRWIHDYGLCAWSEITCTGCYCIVTLGSGLIICNSLVPRSFFHSMSCWVEPLWWRLSAMLEYPVWFDVHGDKMAIALDFPWLIEGRGHGHTCKHAHVLATTGLPCQDLTYML